MHVKCSYKLFLNLKEFEKDAIILIHAYRTNAQSNLYRLDPFFLCCQEQSIIFWLRYGKSTSVIIENAFQLCKTPKYTSKCYRTIKVTECVKISLHKFCSLLAITSWHSISLFNGPGKTLIYSNCLKTLFNATNDYKIVRVFTMNWMWFFASISHNIDGILYEIFKIEQSYQK